MKFLHGALAVGAMILLAACTAPVIGPEGPVEGESAVGTVLTDADGMTLYTYAPDEPGKSNCTGFCAVFWPPAEAAEGTVPGDGFQPGSARKRQPAVGVRGPAALRLSRRYLSRRRERRGRRRRLVCGPALVKRP